MVDLVRKVTLGRIGPRKFDAFKTGDTVSVYVKVREGEKERIQVFKGVVTKLQGSGMSRSFTVRKISSGVGVERTFPFASPVVDNVRVEAVGRVRRSRLYYLRSLKGKAAKVQSDLVSHKNDTAEQKTAPTPAEQASAESTEA